MAAAAPPIAGAVLRVCLCVFRPARQPFAPCVWRSVATASTMRSATRLSSEVSTSTSTCGFCARCRAWSGLDREARARGTDALQNGSGLRSRWQRRPAAPGLARRQRRHDFGALGFGHLLPKADFQRRPAATLAVLAVMVHAADVDAWVGDGNGWDHDFVRVDVADMAAEDFSD